MEQLLVAVAEVEAAELPEVVEKVVLLEAQGRAERDFCLRQVMLRKTDKNARHVQLLCGTMDKERQQVYPHLVSEEQEVVVQEQERQQREEKVALPVAVVAVEEQEEIQLTGPAVVRDDPLQPGPLRELTHPSPFHLDCMPAPPVLSYRALPLGPV